MSLANYFIYILFLFIPLFSQQEYLFRSDKLEMKGLKSSTYEQIGKSPFYVSKKRPLIGNVISQNKKYKLSSWFYDKLQVEKAHQITKGNSDIVIGIIDSGTDLNNKNLTSHTWVNYSEDLNHNGKIDPFDLNGIDDDGNGYIDDVIGYDFVDTPLKRKGKDFQGIDPFPQDEIESTGHGTLIHSQLIDLVPSARFMILRVADGNGLLEEDDIARAIIYAVENKAHILNMSFGNFTYSAFLESVINYAVNRGLICVAASGNEGISKINYPARFSAVIAVGNSTKFDTRSFSSNYSSNIDLVAPGTSIQLLGLNETMFSVSGTSFSAPFVSGTIALILDQFPDLSSEEIRQQLRLSSDDIGKRGFDKQTGSGRLNIFRAVSEFSHNELLIHNPLPEKAINNSDIPIVITASGTHINNFSIEISSNDKKIYHKYFSHRFFNHDTIVTLKLSNIADGKYKITIISALFDGKEIRKESIFYIDRKEPIIEYSFFDRIVQGNQKNVFLEYQANETSRFELRDPSGKIIVEQNNLKKEQFLTIDFDIVREIESLRLVVFDRAGNYTERKLSVPTNLGYFRKALAVKREKIKKKRSIISEIKTDLNQNGMSEYWLFTFTKAQKIDSLFIFEMPDKIPHFLKTIKTDLFLRDAKANKLMFSYSGRSEIWQSNSLFQFKKIASSTTGLATRFLNIDKNEYVLLRKEDQFIVTSANMDKVIFKLPNFSKNATFLGIPRIEFIQNNDSTFLFYADANANIVSYLYTKSVGFTPNGTVKSRYKNGTHNLKLLGKNLYHLSENTSTSLSQDNSYSVGRRILTKYDYRTLSPIGTLTFGDARSESSNSFLTTLKINKHEYLGINISGKFFIIDENINPFYTLDNFDSYSLSVDSNKIFVNQEDGSFRLTFGIDNTIFIETLTIKQPLDNFFRLNYYASANDIILTRIFEAVGNTAFTKIDSNMNKKVSLFYPISSQTDSVQFAVQFLTNTQVSRLFKTKKLKYRAKPRLLSFQVYDQQIIELRFDREMDFSAKKGTIEMNYGKIQSLFSSLSNRLSILYKSQKEDSLKLSELYDLSERLMNDTAIYIPFSRNELTQKILKYNIPSTSKVNIFFNTAIYEPIFVTEVKSNNTPQFSYKDRILSIYNKNRFRYAQHYEYKIKIASNIFYIGFTVGEKITDTILFPNPFILSEHHELSITNIPNFSKLSIFTFGGKRIFNQTFTEKKEHFLLNFKNKIGYNPSSGIYFYVIESETKLRRGKFTIIR